MSLLVHLGERTRRLSLGARCFTLMLRKDSLVAATAVAAGLVTATAAAGLAETIDPGADGRPPDRGGARRHGPTSAEAATPANAAPRPATCRHDSAALAAALEETTPPLSPDSIEGEPLEFDWHHFRRRRGECPPADGSNEDRSAGKSARCQRHSLFLLTTAWMQVRHPSRSSFYAPLLTCRRRPFQHTLSRQPKFLPRCRLSPKSFTVLNHLRCSWQ